MFTGIVQGLCRVSEVVDETRIRRLIVDLGELGNGLQLGASVAINGTCLTATRLAGRNSDDTSFDVINESLNQTNLGDLVEGAARGGAPILVAVVGF